jgi:hypothetical protein
MPAGVIPMRTVSDVLGVQALPVEAAAVYAKAEAATVPTKSSLRGRSIFFVSRKLQ